MGGRTVLRAAVVILLVAGRTAADTFIIDSHTALVPAHGELSLAIAAGPEGSVLTGASLGLVDRISVGMSYGMAEVLGRGELQPNPRPGFQIQALLLDEPSMPAIAIGFDSQGHGRWLDQYDRYERKSPGIYIVGTQHLLATSYDLLSAVNGGISYSLEPNREGIDLFIGASQSFGRGLSVLLDYDFALDDAAGIDADRGYLDLGFQWRFGSGNNLRFLLRDLLGNYLGQGKVARELNFFYLVHL